jgi:hypothetical protein
MITINDSLLSTTTTIEPNYQNSTIEIHDTSTSSTIITIIILSFLSISGWIFMSYALFGRSEAYRTKPDDQHGISHSNRTNSNDFIVDFD